ncbi:DUF1566 domain-containing protein [Chromatium okenii]|uniref:Lcl C-terminal domain-containing protein n=1 Tax=Chromatium okenii TaxID=61644 RepID=UPI0026F344E0|nr:DUF1566 domain-containing protein [Chromatium okenii]MBV5309698.1 DUF1566 domain-containing protein [Chromatium okenii]
MHDEPRHKLRELILKYGQSLCNDSQRCEALLKDVCGQYRKEIFVLTTALKNRVADELLKNSAGIPPTLLAARLIKRLEDDAALNSEAAHWAVESWMLALGVIAQPLPRSNTTLTSVPVSIQQSAVNTAPIPVAPSPHITKTLLNGRYRDNNDGTVTDVKTNLQWMRCSLGQEWKNGTCIGKAKRYNWDDAHKAVESLNRNIGYAGYQDWRLPTIDELKSLVYCSSGQPKPWNDTGKPCEGNYAKPTIDSGAFPNTPSSWFWSGSPIPNSDGAWNVNFNDGYLDLTHRSNDYHVRLVRGGQ